MACKGNREKDEEEATVQLLNNKEQGWQNGYEHIGKGRTCGWVCVM